MSQMNALEISKWFIKNQFDSPRDTYDGNMKLQKLLYFAQLIHVAKNGELLFNDEMRAYRNGTVINNVRFFYRDHHNELIAESHVFNEIEDESVKQTLQLTVEVFGDMSPRELSDLNHELSSWKIPYHDSRTDEQNGFVTEKSLIDPSDRFFLDDVEKVGQMLSVYEIQSNDTASEIINGVTFHYDPNEIQLTEEILSQLADSTFPDESYSLTFDEEQGVIIS